MSISSINSFYIYQIHISAANVTPLQECLMGNSNLTFMKRNSWFLSSTLFSSVTHLNMFQLYSTSYSRRTKLWSRSWFLFSLIPALVHATVLCFWITALWNWQSSPLKSQVRSHFLYQTLKLFPSAPGKLQSLSWPSNPSLIWPSTTYLSWSPTSLSTWHLAPHHP